MLLFKQKFLTAIRAGEKTQTIRLGKSIRYRAGQRSYIPGAGYIRIEAVDELPFESLTESDALLDGFPSLAALQTEIAAIYGQQPAQGLRVFRIRFALLPPDEQAQARAESQARKNKPLDSQTR